MKLHVGLSLILIFTASCSVSSDGKNAMAESIVAGSRPGEALRECAECPEMVIVPAGDFTMGSPAHEPGRYEEEGPQRRVHIRQFAVGKFRDPRAVGCVRLDYESRHKWGLRLERPTQRPWR